MSGNPLRMKDLVSVKKINLFSSSLMLRQNKLQYLFFVFGKPLLISSTQSGSDLTCKHQTKVKRLSMDILARFGF
jgi:hypothetical protein